MNEEELIEALRCEARHAALPKPAMPMSEAQTIADLQSRLIQRTEQATATAYRDAETIRRLLNALDDLRDTTHALLETGRIPSYHNAVSLLAKHRPSPDQHPPCQRCGRCGFIEDEAMNLVGECPECHGAGRQPQNAPTEPRHE